MDAFPACTLAIMAAIDQSPPSGTGATPAPGAGKFNMVTLISVATEIYPYSTNTRVLLINFTDSTHTAAALYEPHSWWLPGEIADRR